MMKKSEIEFILILLHGCVCTHSNKRDITILIKNQFAIYQADKRTSVKRIIAVLKLI